MEQSDTEPPFQDFEIFEELIQDSSFAERFDSCDIKEIISSDDQYSNVGNSSDEQTSSSSSVWDLLDNDVCPPEVNLNVDANPNYLDQPPSTVVASKKMVRVGESIYLVEESSATQIVEVPLSVDIPPERNTECLPSLSLQPWKGNFDFSVSLETTTHSSSKWVYSNILQKLFLRPFEAVPIEVKMSVWIDGFINITPMYTSSEHNAKPVNRCPNHRMQDEEKNVPYPEHIVQVENPDACYRVDGARCSVDIPLGVPAPGEASKLLYVKCGCWNTCTGGPSRKAFCLLFTLFNRSREEIGRQILHLKVCACPVRDRQYNEKSLKENNQERTDEVKINLASGLKKKLGGSMTKMSLKKIKCEPKEPPPSTPGGTVKVESSQRTYEQISVPSEIAAEVKRHVNRLMAELYAKENDICLPFPEQ